MPVIRVEVPEGTPQETKGADAWEKLPHVKRLLDEINARPAAQRVEALKTKFAFKTEVDDDPRKMLFPSNERLKTAGI